MYISLHIHNLKKYIIIYFNREVGVFGVCLVVEEDGGCADLRSSPGNLGSNYNKVFYGTNLNYYIQI